MTCIAGFSRVGKSAIAGDRQATSASSKFSSFSKIYKINDQVAVGYAGSYVTQSWMTRNLAPCLKAGDPTSEDYIDVVREAWEAYRAFQVEKGRGTKDAEGALLIPGELLVVTCTAVYTCYEDGCVLEHELYGAIGSGRDCALGAMCALADPNPHFTVKDIVRSAIEAAIQHDIHCGGDIDVIEVIA